MNNINNQIRNYKLRESKRKLVGLEITRRKRAELNDLINKELRIKNGAQNLLSVCKNAQTEERLRLELTFVESKIRYLKDQLSELNCDFTLFKMKNSNTKLNNSLSCSSSSSTTSSTSSQTAKHIPEILVTPSSNDEFRPLFSNSLSSNSSINLTNNKSTDLMIYLNLKETYNGLDFTNGFKEFIAKHYKEDPCNYIEQIRQFNYFRESTIRLSYEPSLDSIKRLFEYFNSLFLIEKRFFQDSKCNSVNFTWFDSINGVESTQKSIQFEKASIMFNCATLFTQLAAICCDGNDQKLEEQLIYWQRATGCLTYLNATFSNSPNSDMCSFVLQFLIDTFKCQAYETKAKLFIANNDSIKYDPKRLFVNYANSAKIYSHVADSYSQIKSKLDNNISIKNYLPEIWYNLIKVKSIYYKGLSHYFAATAIIINGLETVYDNLEVQVLFDSLHDRTASKVKTMRQTGGTYFHKKIIEQQQLYDSNVLRDEKKFHLARAHIRESLIWHEEAIRQHSLCRKFTKDDYLHSLLRYYHDLSLDKFLQLEHMSSDGFESELFDVLPINFNLNDKLILNPIEPNFQQYESKDFFNLIGPLKIYSSEFDLSIPFTCILKKTQNQQSFGITVKGDCPVRVNQVDLKSLAYHVGIREGDYIIAIQDQDVRWSKHSQVVEKIRSYSNIVKLTLINIKPRLKESAIMCEEEEDKFTKMINSPAMTQRLRHRLSPKSGVKTTPNRLFNFVKRNSTPQNIPLNKIFLQQQPIIFNKEDDEIYNDKDNLRFWQHLNTKFTNTITLGRKFKRNVLKMSIFNTFATSETEPPDKIDNNLALKDLWSNEKAKKSYSRNKILRNNKHKKLLQKTLDSMSKDENNNNTNINTSRLLSYQSNLYKTL